jgi:hypothetical protein
MAPIARLSGLQKDVLALYRSILRESIRKDRKVASSLLSSSSTSSSSSASSQQQATPTDATDEAAAAASSSHHHQHRSPFVRIIHSSSNDSSAATNTTTLDYARKKFRQEAAQVPRSDFKTIEYKIRKGRKQLELLKMPGVNVVGGA